MQARASRCSTTTPRNRAAISCSEAGYDRQSRAGIEPQREMLARKPVDTPTRAPSLPKPMKERMTSLAALSTGSRVGS